MDFIEGLPSSHGYNSIFVVIDRLTKYAHFMSPKHPYIASTVAECFINNIHKLHGLPTTIISDRDSISWQFLAVPFQVLGNTAPAQYRLPSPN